jgi:hypothetical protein
MSQTETHQRMDEVMYALTGIGDIQMRLTYVADALTRLDEGVDLPEHLARRLRDVKAQLLTTPLSDDKKYVPRSLSDPIARELAHKILSIYRDFLTED